MNNSLDSALVSGGFILCNNVLEGFGKPFQAASTIVDGIQHAFQRPASIFNGFNVQLLVAVNNDDHGGFVGDVPLLPLPLPPVNLGAPLRRIVTDGLGEACQDLQIAVILSRGFES